MVLENSSLTRLGNSGLRINHAVVGTMLFDMPPVGDVNMGVSEEDSLAILKKCYDEGLRTFDTANAYGGGNSEKVIGKFLKQYNIPRANVVIMTKCFLPIDFAPMQGPSTSLNFNDRGLSRKHILDAVKGSVERLGTHIDLLQIHRYDPEVPDEEIMRALNDVVESGQVRYLGASSMKTYQFIGLQNTAEKHGWHKFVSMQSLYNLLYREDERELNEYCKKTGVGLLPWSPNARGLLAIPTSSEKSKAKFQFPFYKNLLHLDVENDPKIIDRVEEVSKQIGCSMVEVAGGWLMAKGANPIIGLTLVDSIESILKLVNIKLTDEQVKYLEEPYRPKAGFHS